MAVACVPQTACDSSTSVGMTRGWTGTMCHPDRRLPKWRDRGASSRRNHNSLRQQRNSLKAAAETTSLGCGRKPAPRTNGTKDPCAIRR